MKKLKTIIADDHAMFGMGMAEIIGQVIPVEVVAIVDNGKKAIEQTLSHKAELVIMDIDMPVVSGIYACNEIKRVSPETLVFFVTMITQIETVLSALKAGADAYVLKGNSMEDLADAFSYSAKKKHPFVSQQLRHLVNIGKERSQDNLITEREKYILKMICEGMTNDEIANVINISVRTVDTHRQNMLNKLKLPNTAALVRFAIENKLI